jgi:hypothetical protein
MTTTLGKREIPKMIAEYFDVLEVANKEDNFDTTQDITYVNTRKIIFLNNFLNSII